MHAVHGRICKKKKEKKFTRFPAKDLRGCAGLTNVSTELCVDHDKLSSETLFVLYVFHR